MNKFNKEPHKSHNKEPNTGSPGDCRELLTVGFGALLHEVDRLLHELLERLYGELLDVGHFVCLERGFGVRT